MSWKKIALAAFVSGFAAHWVQRSALRARARRTQQLANDQLGAEERWEDDGGAMLPPWRHGADEAETRPGGKLRQRLGA